MDGKNGEHKYVFPCEIMDKYKSHQDYCDRIAISDAIGEAFKFACYCGKLDVAKGLESIGDVDYLRAFVLSCSGGQINVAKWLYLELGSIEDVQIIEDAFEYSIFEGHMDVVEWLYELFRSSYPNEFMTSQFLSFCLNGNVERAKWLFNRMKQIDIDEHFAETLYSICLNGKQEIFELFKPTIEENKIEIGIDTFKEVCRHNHVEIARYIINHIKLSELDFDETFGLNLGFSDEMTKFIISTLELPDEYVDQYIPVHLADDAFNEGYRPIDRLLPYYSEYVKKNQEKLGQIDCHKLFSYRYLVKLISEY